MPTSVFHFKEAPRVNENPNRSPTQTENSSYSLFGQHVSDESDSSQNLDGPRYISFSVARSRICNKHKAICPSTRR